MSGAYSRSKGARAEREVVILLRDYLGIEVNRQLKQYQQAQHGDIEQLVGPYLIEVKNCATLAIPSWWAQTVAAAKARNAVPCLVYRIARKKSMEDRWRFVVPEWWAWDTGHDWRWDLRYTKTVGIEAFAGNVRERGG